MVEQTTEVSEHRCDRCNMRIKIDYKRGRRIIMTEKIRDFIGPFRVVLGDKVLISYDKLCHYCADHMISLSKSSRQLGRIDRSKGGRKKC